MSTNNLVEITAGGIKEDDCKRYPPFGIAKSKILLNNMGQRLIPQVKKGNTTYNAKAKEGFNYWYQEPKANITGEIHVTHKVYQYLI